MPTFRWQGRARGGQRVQGNIQGSSREDVLRLLQEQQIVVTEVTEAAGGFASDAEPPDPERRRAQLAGDNRPRPFRGLLITLAFVVASIAVGSFAPLTTYSCTRAGNGRADCTVDERIFGFVPLKHFSLAGVTRVERESSSSVYTQSGKGPKVPAERLVLHDARGNSIRPSRWASADSDHFGSSLSDIDGSLSGFLSDIAPGSISRWQMDWVPLIIPAVLMLIALLMLVLSIIAFMPGTSRRLQERAAKLTEELQQQRRERLGG